MNQNNNNYEKLKLENQLCFPLYACARKVTNLYHPFLKELGITYTQYLVFLVLWEEDHLTVGEIGRRLYLDNGTLTPLLKKMEKAGFVTRTRLKEDERVVVIELTPEGKALREKALQIPECVATCMHIRDKDAEKLYELLYKLLNECGS